MSTLEIKNLHVSISDGDEKKDIIKGLDLTVREGEIHAIMGPNGSGKSTLSYAIMGHPNYEITEGDVVFDGKSINDMSPDERAKLGLFLSFQYPSEVDGVSVSNFLWTAHKAIHGEGKMDLKAFRSFLLEKMELLKMDKAFARRYVNTGFSGGEKKRSEILQLAVLQPKMAILDETDSGLDIDALRTVAEGINTITKDSSMGVLLITHYQRLLNYIRPDHVHIMVDGKIVQSGGHELAEELEAKGYELVNGGADNTGAEGGTA